MTNYLIISTLLLVATNCSEERYPGPLTPEEALQSFQLAEGFQIEIFAAEPEVMDPVELVFDERGAAFVVEMPDYPYKPEAGQAKGRIKKLVDTNGDGKIDRSVVFAEGLSEATSALPWREGLLVTAAPHIYFLKDTTGDDRADVKEVLFSGFFENNSEAQITNLRFSIDNWIYAANFGQPGEVTFVRNQEAPALSMRGGDFRFRLDRGQFELATGPTQFGQAINDWGHRFMTQNTLHLRHAVIPHRYLARNPYLPSKNAVVNISDHDLRMFQDTPPPYWRAERTRRRQKRYDEENLDRIEYAEDHFTGASGATVYAGDAFPADFYGNIFIGDVAGNLIHRDILTLQEDSPTFLAQRSDTEKDREFLSSTDSWFRPANFTLGPDGYLYVIDYYRQHIETPLSIPEDLKAEMDFYRGSDRGRIYRIRPAGLRVDLPDRIDLRQMSSPQLAQQLANPNRWWRLHAQRLLLERQDQSVLPIIRQLFADAELPITRLHALYVLEGLNALNAKTAESALRDPHPRIREHGLILSERFPENQSLMLESVQDEDIRVVFQACLSLGRYPDSEVVESMAEIAEHYGENEWFRKALLTSEAVASADFVSLLVTRGKFFLEYTEEKAELLSGVASVIGARNDETEILTFKTILEGMGKPWEESYPSTGAQ